MREFIRFHRENVYRLFPLDVAPVDDIPVLKPAESAREFANQVRNAIQKVFPSVRVCVIDDDNMPMAAILLPICLMERADEIFALVPSSWTKIR